MSGLALSTYCGLLDKYYEFLALGHDEVVEELAQEMDDWWEQLTEEEQGVASSHAYQLAERYMS